MRLSFTRHVLCLAAVLAAFAATARAQAVPEFQKILETYSAALRCQRRRDAGRPLQSQRRLHARGHEGCGRAGRLARLLQDRSSPR